MNFDDGQEWTASEEQYSPERNDGPKKREFYQPSPRFFRARDRVETQLLRDSEAEAILRLPMRRVGRPGVVRPITPTPKPWPVRSTATTRGRERLRQLQSEC